MHTRTFLVATAIACSSAAVFAQDNGVHHNNFAIGFGPAIPAGNSTTYLQTAPLVAFSYGYRLNRYFQADAGLHPMWGAANNQNAVVTDLGAVQGGDHEYIFPLGGRVLLPQPFNKLEVSAGGGGAYFHYSETAPSSGYYQVNCYSCSSRGGWGGYGLANVNYFLDGNRNFHVGTTFEYFSGSTRGQAVGNVVGFSTSDHWANLTFEFGISF